MADATTSIRRCYLVRHAIAEPRGADWPDDDLRPLTGAGARKMKQVVRGLARLDADVELILTSPLVRARQTAEIISRWLPSRPDVETLPALAPGHTPAATMRALAAATDAGAVLLVGHEPDLGALVAWLIDARRPVAFKKGGACRVDSSRWPMGPRSDLRWFMPPSVLRRLR
jgi:phosphohistidine phosphatase